MDDFLRVIFSVFVSAAILCLIIFINKKRRLPPGPLALPIVGNLLWLKHSISSIEPILTGLFKTYGPIVTLHIGSRPGIFIQDRSIAHKALIEHGATFSDRPSPSPASSLLNSNRHNITTSSYGPLWRLLRRNLTSEILHSSKVKIYGEGRDWVLDILIQDLKANSQHSTDGSVVVKDSVQFAMFCLLVLMCFGEKLDEKGIREIEIAQTELLLYSRKLNVFAFFPWISKYVFYGRWKTMTDLRRKQMDVFLPLINARREHKLKQKETEERFVYSYLDSILDINLPDEGGRNLSEDEIVSLCSEFLIAGTDTTSTAMQWILAELVKNKEVQRKLFEEIDSSMADNESRRVREDELHKMTFLKSVVLEGLRRHPPGHFVLSHSVTEDIEIEGYVIPKHASVNFTVAEMGWDEKTWPNPMEFKPERFMKGGEGETIDITGSREIKMMPFGVGRRICPGIGLAILHLEFFVANLIREFEWECVEGAEVDLTEKLEFTVVMKHPLRARLIPRTQGWKQE